MTNHPHSTPPDQPGHWEALARYLAGESSAEEASAMRRWLEADPARGELAAALQQSMDRVAFTPPVDLDVENALLRVKSRRDEVEVRELQVRGAPSHNRWSTIGLSIAAAILVLLGGALLWQAMQGSESNAPAGVVAQTFTTPVGRTDSVNLSDGTRVILGPGSRLAVLAEYGDRERAVELQGEALFDVRHDDAKPFRVRAGGATISDLGTTFTVRSIGVAEVVVVVTEGSVRLMPSATAADSGVILRAGDRGVLSSAGSVQAQPGGASDADLAWTRGDLVFSNASLEHVQAELRRWYGIELRLDDPYLPGHVTATFKNGEPVQQVLNIIALTQGAQITRRGDTAFMRRAEGGVVPR